MRTSHLSFRIISLYLFFFSTISFFVQSLSAQECGGYGELSSVTSSGVEFLLCFMQNEDSQYNLRKNINIYLAATGDTSTVTITCKAFPRWVKEVRLPAHGSFVYHLSLDTLFSNPILDQFGNTIGTNDPIMELSDTISPF